MTIFTTDTTWRMLVEAADFYQQRGRWHVSLLLAMLDHLHMLAAFPAQERMAQVVAAWKHYLARVAKVPWQRDFFDHRPRNRSEREERESYIRQNPVRAELVAEAAAWPYRWP
jgi:putative transposase